MRILAMMKYGALAASTRQRLLQFQPDLTAQGIELEVSPLLGNAYVGRIGRSRRSGPVAIGIAYMRRLAVLLSARHFDVIWLHYELLPYMPGWIEKLVRGAGRPVVLDFDDAIFHLYDAHPSGLVRRVLGCKFQAVLRSADLVFAGNTYLADYARRFNDAVMVVPTVVDTHRYVPVPARDRPRVVGWIGSPSTWRYVVPILPAILPAIRQRGGTFLAVGGGPDADRYPGIESRPWSEASEIGDVQSMDIGIMPLPDEQWTRGKCGYKLIQYMACGRPVVASPVGVNVEIVTHGYEGLIAVTPDEWAAAIACLMDDKKLCLQMGDRGRAKVVERYSLESQAPRIADALTRLAQQTR